LTAAYLERVTKRFGTVTALDDFSLRVEEGESVAILGPNGAGKSTALAVLLGLRRPERGRVMLLGADPRVPANRYRVGVTTQETAFPLTVRVSEVIDLVRAHYRAPLPTSTVLERFGLTRLAHRQLGGLSGGEKRRVAVALAFSGAPKLVVLDEPTAGLDVGSRNAVWSAIRAQVEGGGTVLLTTHHLDEAEALAERVVLIESGAVVADGKIAEIKSAAGLTRISFRAPPEYELDGAGRDGPFVRIFVPDAGATVARLVEDGVPLVDLEVRSLTLEEAVELRTSSR
jgi:ABC-2 type transport system ATP-binding protein